MDKFQFNKTAINALPTPEKGKRVNYGDTSYPFFFLRVTPTAKTFYYQRTIKPFGKKVISIDTFNGNNVVVARKEAEVINTELVAGFDRTAQVNLGHDDDETFGWAWEDFRINRTRGKGKISKSHDSNWAKEFADYADMPLADMTKKFARGLILEKRKTAPIHANRVHALGKAIINHAIREMDWEGINPFAFSMMSEKGRSRKRFRLLPSDMPSFMHALTFVKPAMRHIFLVSLFTGRRIGEVKSMRWSELNLRESLWEMDTKVGEIQTALLSKPVIKILNERHAQALKNNQEDDWVFPSYSDSGHIETISVAWEIIRKHGFQDLRANDLRGTLASWLTESEDIASASQQLGHADISTTATNYQFNSNAFQKVALDAVAEKIEQAARGELPALEAPEDDE